MEMPGVDFERNEQGEPVAVRIDLEQHHELWEDLYDAYVARLRKHEPTESWEDVKRELGLGLGQP